MPGKYGNRGRTEKRRAVGGGNGRGNFKKERVLSKEYKNGHDIINDTKSREDDYDENNNVDDNDEDDEEDDDEIITTSSSYSKLLDSFQVRHGDEKGSRKRRKLNDDVKDKVEMIEEHDVRSYNSDDNDEMEEEHEDEQRDDALQEDEQYEKEGEENDNDPYNIHFSPKEDVLNEKVQRVKDRKWHLNTEEKNGQKILRYSCDDRHDSIYSTTKSLPLKQRLVDPSSSLSIHPSLNQSLLLSTIFSYKDLIFTCRTPSSGQSLREITSLHILNHVLKSRDRILRNTTRLHKLSSNDQSSPEIDLRDQGFTRPRVLLLLETRQQCYSYIQSLLELFQPSQKENWSRFQSSFHDPTPPSSNMPDSYNDIFAGNSDSDFRIGIKFTRTAVKLFSAFYSADILLCSPLGLRRILSHQDPKRRDSDFLSSIEIVVADQLDAMAMQNGEHVKFCFENLNLQPKEAHGVDFSRVKSWYLDGQAKYLRQTILLSLYNLAEINNLTTKELSNVEGRVKVQDVYPGAIESITRRFTSGKLKQTFSRFESTSPITDPDQRFNYFSSAILPFIIKHAGMSSTTSPAGILIFIPTYPDFVRLRNFFAASSSTEMISFGSLGEYNTVTEARRAKSHLLTGKNQVLLYSGRAHHFHRYKFRGIKKLIWYGLPDNVEFYEELLEEIASDIDHGKTMVNETISRCIFSKWDILKLERIVGSSRINQMTREIKGDTFDFV